MRTYEIISKQGDFIHKKEYIVKEMDEALSRFNAEYGLDTLIDILEDGNSKLARNVQSAPVAKVVELRRSLK